MACILGAHELNQVRERKYMVYERKFSKASEKNEIENELSVEMRKYIRSESLITEILGASDEMITNVLYNAPYVNNQNSTSGIDRRIKKVGLPSGKFGKIKCGVDDHRIVLGCEDPFGKLNINTLLKRLKGCYDNGIANSMNMGVGGAGIGMFLVANSSVSFYAAVVPGSHTAIYCVLPRKMNNRKRSVEAFNLHILNLLEKQE
jgi:hypothetical protein